MDDAEKRELAKLLLPHLAWDLGRVEVMTFEHRPDVSAAAAAMFIEQVTATLRAKAMRGETFTVAIIPSAG